MAVFKRKIMKELQKWKDGRRDYAVIVLGARGVGKTTAVTEFAKRNYDSYILIDFSKQREEVDQLFWDIWDKDAFYKKLEAIYDVKLVPGHSVIIFDEVQYFMRARECIDFLVKDGRYDFLETSTLEHVSIARDKIRLPGEEHSVDMYPMDFEEFLWALYDNDDFICEGIRTAYESLVPLGSDLHSSLMDAFRIYMLVGGMPKAVAAYMSGADEGFALAEQAKQMIWGDHAEYLARFGGTDEEKTMVQAVLKEIPGQLSDRDKTFDITDLSPDASWDDNYVGAFCWLDDAGIINGCLQCAKPEGYLRSNLGETSFKCYVADTGLLVTLYNLVKKDTYTLYHEVLAGRLGVKEGMLLENAVAQMLAPSRRDLYFYRHYDGVSKLADIDADFMVYEDHRICPVDVRAVDATGRGSASLERLKARYERYIGKGYVLHTGNVAVKDDIIYLPVYMAMYL
ncbi:MAG: AAA family ATPase [Clostridia bacterium]|nr:AAA family ATPase [Clostridia bacterium]